MTRSHDLLFDFLGTEGDHVRAKLMKSFQGNHDVQLAQIRDGEISNTSKYALKPLISVHRGIGFCLFPCQGFDVLFSDEP